MTPDQQLIQQLRQGDEGAFAALYERYSALLLNHLFCMLGKRELAEEVLHEVFITMIAKINFYEEQPHLKNSFKAWLYRIATNRAIDEIRKTKNVPSTFAAETTLSLDPEESFEQIHLQHRIQGMLGRLPLIQRTVLSLKLNDDLNHFEIAQICSCNVNAVKQGLFQARRSMKTMLQAEGMEL